MPVAKAAKTAPEPGQEDSILTQLAAKNPPPEPEPKPTVDVDALLHRIAALESGLDRANQTNIALMSQPPAPATSYQTQPAYNSAPVQSQPAQMQFGPMPDPVTDPEGFNKALADRITGSIGAAMTAQQTVQSQKSREQDQADALWNRFEDQYPDLASHKRIVGLSAADVAQDLKNRGVDLNRYMTVAGDDFLKQVADRVKKDFGPMVSGEGQEPMVPARTALANRTAGVFGGAEGPGAGGKPAEVELGSISQDLAELQKKEGYF